MLSVLKTVCVNSSNNVFDDPETFSICVVFFVRRSYPPIWIEFDFSIFVSDHSHSFVEDFDFFDFFFLLLLLRLRRCVSGHFLIYYVDF